MEPIKISGSHWKQYATIIICIVFMAIGIFVPIDDPTSENILVGSLCFLFFGSLGAFLCYTLFFKPPSHLLLSSKGLEIFTFGLPPLMIKWQDIEKIDTSWMQYNHVTRIRLNSYDNILASFKPENEKKLVKLMKATRIAGYGAAVVGAYLGEQVTDLVDAIPSNAESKNLVAILKHSRDKYGGEIVLHNHMRDRGAGKFAEFLRQKKKEFGY